MVFVSSERFFKRGASGTATQFFEWFYVRIDVFVPHHKFIIYNNKILHIK